MDKICMYLRKSRADEEMEKTLGEGETLSKHRKALLKFAKEKNLNIVEIKEEIVSGESLFFRPEMLELLKEVENNKYNGVLVMDMQRLGRGDMKDQGVILETFKNSNTKIITPQKIYDLNNDFDEEYTEFEAFMSRKELKMINRRMQGGRVRSVEDGNYIATNPPYGYDVEYINRGRVLKINKHEAEAVKLMFNLYIDGFGGGGIAQRLNELGYKTKINNDFSRTSVIFILKNPAYIGKITWKKKDIRKSKTPGKITDTKTRDKKDWIVVDGKHEPIIDIETWNKVQEILDSKYHIPYQLTNTPVNPFAGLITCGFCGKKMAARKLRGVRRLLCPYNCENRSSRFDYVEKAVLDALEDYLKKYKFNIKAESNINNTKIYENQLPILTKELVTLNNQKLKLFDLLERGIYSEEVFLERSKNIDLRMETLKSNIEKIKKELSKESKTKKQDNIIIFENAINGYKKSNDVRIKNELLKSILYKIEYKKNKKQRDDNFEIKIFPKLLK